MDDMARTRYLVGEGAKRKLKRNIPKGLQALAGKTAFVERVGRLSGVEIKERANRFAFQTDGELSRLKRLSLRPLKSLEPSGNIELNDVGAQQIAVAYFRGRYDKLSADGSFFVARTSPDYAAILAEAAEDRQEALDRASGLRVYTDPRALQLLVEHGVISNEYMQCLLQDGWPRALANHREFQLLCRLIERADLELARLRLDAVERGELTSIRDDLFTGSHHHRAAQATIVPSKSLGSLLDLFRQTKEGSVTRSRYNQFEIPIRTLEEQFGKKLAIANIKRDECRKIATLLPRIPRHVTQHYGRAAIADAAEAFEAKNGKSASRHKEAQKHLQVITSIFDLAVNERWIDANPWRGIKIEVPKELRKKHLTKGTGYKPFSVAQLNQIFALPLFTGCRNDGAGCHIRGPNIIRRSRYWLPIVALWTGMRMNEILQLEKMDIRRSGGGVWYISATDETAQEYDTEQFAKRLKNENSLRNIPIHPMLERIGFLDWVEKRGPGRLFPEATNGSAEKPSDNFSKRFASNLKAACVWEPRKLVFHSFRGTFNDALKAAGVPKEHREAINGWREQRDRDGRYGYGVPIETLAAEVAKVEYPGLSVQHLIDAAA